MARDLLVPHIADPDMPSKPLGWTKHSNVPHRHSSKPSLSRPNVLSAARMTLPALPRWNCPPVPALSVRYSYGASPTQLAAPTASPSPLPHARPTACRRTPGLFDVAYGEATAPEAADRIRTAKALCRRCPVAADCLRWALTHPTATPPTSGPPRPPENAPGCAPGWSSAWARPSTPVALLHFPWSAACFESSELMLHQDDGGS